MSLYGMRRANGDWFAIDDNGRVCMPIFRSSGEAMMARSYELGMECFRPVAFAARDLEELKRTDGDSASFLIVADPSRGAKHGSRLGFTELASLMTEAAKGAPNGNNNHRSSKR
jgi:hypothetical protein